MPIAPTQIAENEEVQVVIAEPDHQLKYKSLLLETAYFSEDANGWIRINPGLILAQNSTSKKYTPYSASVSYGPGSDTAVGVLPVIQDGTYDEPAVVAVAHGKVIEANCYVYGQNGKGSIPAAVKAALDDIIWV